ncbi:hypothetical protein Bbelb_316870 [Branchiostoma belcheri]|nr:hypothetical protein Bbelb_316870 [Branchiostoma belcheri]
MDVQIDIPITGSGSVPELEDPPCLVFGETMIKTKGELECLREFSRIMNIPEDAMCRDTKIPPGNAEGGGPQPQHVGRAGTAASQESVSDLVQTVTRTEADPLTISLISFFTIWFTLNQPLHVTDAVWGMLSETTNHRNRVMSYGYLKARYPNLALSIHSHEMAEGQGKLWSSAETQCLLAISIRIRYTVNNKEIQAQLDSFRNKDAHGKIAAEMTVRQTTCSVVRDANKKSGSGRVTCQFYEELDNILGHRPATQPSSTPETVDTLICEMLKTKHKVTSAYHPQTNGLDEGTNGNIKSHSAPLTGVAGLQFKNENLSSDMADVLKFFHQHVPAEMDGEGRIQRLLLVYHRIFYKADSAGEKATLASNMNVTRNLSEEGAAYRLQPVQSSPQQTDTAILSGCTVLFGWGNINGLGAERSTRKKHGLTISDPSTTNSPSTKPTILMIQMP